MTDFNARKRFHYKAQLQRADGTILERDIHNFWSPEKENTLAEVANAAAAEAAFETRNGKGEKIHHAALSAVLVA